MMSPTKESKETALVTRLNNRSDWTAWYDDIVRIAKARNVWDYVDPDKTVTLTPPPDPSAAPVPVEGWENLEGSAQAAAIELWKTRRQIWSDQEVARARKADDYRQKHDYLIKLSEAVDTSICEMYREYISNVNGLRARIIALKKRVMPLPHQDRENAHDKFLDISQQRTIRDWDSWATQFERAYEHTQRLGVETVNEAVAVKAFLRAVQQHAPAFWTFWTQYSMAERAKPEEQARPVELRTLIDRFRENEQELKLARATGSLNATSGQKSPNPASKGPRLQKAKCPGCLRVHPVNIQTWWEDCWSYKAVFHPEHSRQGFVVHAQAKSLLEKWLRENPAQAAKAKAWNPGKEDAAAPNQGTNKKNAESTEIEIPNQGPAGQPNAAGAVALVNSALSTSQVKTSQTSGLS